MGNYIYDGKLGLYGRPCLGSVPRAKQAFDIMEILHQSQRNCCLVCDSSKSNSPYGCIGMSWSD